MFGILSEGMILSAESTDGDLSLLSLERPLKGGSKIYSPWGCKESDTTE